MLCRFRVVVAYAAILSLLPGWVHFRSAGAQQCMPCQADCNGNNAIEINELVRAVNEALRGCSEIPTQRGELLYSEPHSDGNSFACATCHALAEPAPDGLVRPGHPIGGAPKRSSWKNGQLSAFLDAVNTCRVDWMAATAYAADDEDFLALEEFLARQVAAPVVDDLSFEIVAPSGDIDGGDALAGEGAFNSRCIVCHGESGVGSERAPAVAGRAMSGDFVATKIRRSGNPSSSVYPDLVPGRMPFWSASRISDEQVRDIVAFLAAGDPTPTPVITGGDRVDLSLPEAQRDCGTSHPKVGQTMTFSTVAHRVAGTATIIDDCTIHLDDFSFDGGGIDIQLYGGLGGDYRNGRGLGVNMLFQVFDEGEAVLRLPVGTSLDDLDGLSVWCVAVAFSFGDGLFN